MRNVRPMGAGALAAGCLLLVLSGCPAPEGPKEPPIQEGTKVPDTAGRVISLAQGWSEEQQQWFWFPSSWRR